MTFPEHFIWGSATASYQVEGASSEDGRQPSIWDAYAAEKGRIADGCSGDDGCDQYHHMKEDVQLLSDLRIPNYRFSVSWPRVLSFDADCRGGAVKGIPNEKGIAYYDRLIDELLSKNITPWLTVYHWDLPLELERKGGFRNRDCMYWMEEYASLIAKRYGDRVSNFFTINEMPCVIGGYENGGFAPGLKLSQPELLNIAHNILLCHGTAARTLRSLLGRKANIGFAHCGEALYPASESAADREACRKAQLFPARKTADGYAFDSGNLTYWCDPIHFGAYPEEAVRLFGKDMPAIRDGDMELISTPVDFHGQNIYTGRCVAADCTKPEGYRYVENYAGFPKTAANWPVTPQSLRWLPSLLSERYKKPVIISENGLSCADVPSPDGAVHDPQRIDFTRRYLCELGKTVTDGADIRGYFHWSLLDNFEWARGYQERFGLVYVDYRTKQRIPKDSALWFRSVIDTNGSAL
jgi:beta-glucosidase